MQLGGLAELVEVAEVAVPLAEDERQVVQDDSPVGILRGQAVQGSLEQVAGAIESSSVPRCLVDLAQGDAQVAQKRPLLLARREDLERALVGSDGCGEDAFVARLANSSRRRARSPSTRRDPRPRCCRSPEYRPRQAARRPSRGPGVYARTFDTQTSAP